MRKSVAVHLTNSDPYSAPGGLERYALESSRFAEEKLGIPSLILTPATAEAALAAETRKIHSVHLQHWMNWEPEALFRLAASLVEKTKIARAYLHDYHFVCRQHNLLYNDQSFCGPPEDIATGLCSSCLYGSEVGPHRVRARRLLGLFPLLVSPSESAKWVFCRAFPEFRERIEVVPHLLRSEESAAPQDLSQKKICIIFSGACGYAKGIDRYKELFTALGPRFRWATVGIEDRFKDHSLVTHRHYSFHEGADIGAILEDLKPAVAFLGSIVPETFSYTMHEMLGAGIPVLTTNESGNIAVTIDNTGGGRVFEDFDALRTALKESGEKILGELAANAGRWKISRNDAGLERLYGA